MREHTMTETETKNLTVAVHGCADCPLYEPPGSTCGHPEGDDARLVDIFAVPPRSCPLRRRRLTLRIAEGL